jgi:DNA repair exonuclease SbcCD nuclease subunit
MAFRFIHTADWQIGKTFGQIPLDAGAELRIERLRAVARIAERAQGLGVDAVLVAGDAFDTNAVADRTLIQALDALRAFCGPWVFLPGNHDAALHHSVWSRLRAFGLPPNVIVADEPSVLDRWGGRAVVLPAPLKRRRESADLTQWYDVAATPEGALRIGLAHGSVANRLPGTSEASNEIAEDRATRADLGYLALGDWHGAMEIAPRTYYSGTPEPDRHRANDAGNVYHVAIDGSGAPARVERLPIGRFAWTRLDVSLLGGTADRLAAALDGLGSAPRDTVLALRLAGSVTLAERHRLRGLRALWEARLHHLDVDETDLLDEPTDDDLDAIDTAGFVRLAVDRLRARARDPADPEREVARVALRMIYLDHAGMIEVDHADMIDRDRDGRGR